MGYLATLISLLLNIAVNTNRLPVTPAEGKIKYFNLIFYNVYGTDTPRDMIFNFP